MKDFYRDLGVARSASADEIKKAYRTLAKELHPDRNDDPAAEDRFKQVSQAYDVLSDQKKRALYDQYGEAGLREGFDPSMFQQGFGGGGQGFQGMDGVDIGDLFGFARGASGGASFDINDFIGGRRQRPPAKGRDLETDIEIPLVDALRGCERTVSFQAPRSGSRSIKVRIPKGVTHGQKVRLRGHGDDGPGGRGDLLLKVRIASHPSFWLEGDVLHVKAPVGPLEAYEGAKILVPTPGGNVQVRVPPRSQPGNKLRVRGKGGDKKKGKRDLIVHIDVKLPTTESDEVREAYQVLQDACGDLRDDFKL